MHLPVTPHAPQFDYVQIMLIAVGVVVAVVVALVF
jgi:hypothetical protein